MKKFREFIEGYTTLSESDWQAMVQEFEKKEFSRNEIILEPGKVCRHFYFLESGLIRFYSVVEGDEITKNFTVAPYCFTSRVSFRKQVSSEEGIQALEDTVVWQTSFAQYKKLEKLLSWNLFMRKLLNEIQEHYDNLFLETKSMTAEARYHKLYETYPSGLIHKIPLKHLSSYLGIAPQSLSRIRKKRSGNGIS